jgi:hypothetical protein
LDRGGDRITAAEGQEHLILVDRARYALETELAKLEPRTSANMAVDPEERLVQR